MFEQNVKNSPETRARRRRDGGFTLPELLVTIIVLGSIVAVLSSAIVVTFQQQDNTEGRLNVSRAEQNVSMWIPADLASSGAVPSTDPAASPCSVSVFDTTGCPSNVVLTGSNALLLSWTDSVLNTSGVLVVTTTNVSYHFTPTSGGLFDLVRIECKSTDGGAWTCENNTVLHDLPGPPTGTFTPGVTAPSWVLIVSAPLPPEAVDPGDPTVTYVNNKNANRVVVTINGGGDSDGRGGGINQISITAGGTTRNTIAVPSMANAPTFTQTQSRCGGPITLVVDESNSVGASAIIEVRKAVKAFVETLAGTPVQVQVVRFETRASILGDPAAWTKYYDMTKDTDVTALLAAIPSLQGSWPGGSGQGSTNWEDAIFRTFYAPSDVGAAPLPITPKTVVFFTDGVPTYDRITRRGSPGVLTTQPALPDPGYFASNGSVYSQVAFNRANYWANIWRAADDTKLIGVGVGPDLTDTSKWMANPRAGWRVGWQEMSSFTYQSNWTYDSNWKYESFGPTYEQSTFTYDQLVTTYEERQTWDEQYHPLPWERKKGSGSWQDTTRANYDSNNQSGGPWTYRIKSGGWVDKLRVDYDAPGANTTPYENDQWRRDNPQGGWISRTLAQYNANNTTADESDGVRTSTAWTPSNQTAYNAGNTTNDATDGWRRTTTGIGWTFTTQAVYTAGNTTSDSTDGFRTGTGWSVITKAAYDAGNTPVGNHTNTADGFQRTTTGTTWSPITLAEYDTGNAPAGDHTATVDGFRRTTTGSTWSTITKAEYDSHNTTQADSTDGFRRINPTGTWVQITQAEYNARNTTPSDGTDGVQIGGKEYSPPYTSYDTEVVVDTENAVILARFIAGNDNGVLWSGNLNTNETDANMFIESDWTKVPAALKAVALGECGGTLTLQTKVGSSYAVDPFVYQSSIGMTTVTTSLSATARTFDYDISDGTSRTVVITPANLSDLTAYTAGSWTCKAGNANRPVTNTPMTEKPGFNSMTVVVGANEAVSCVHSVTAS